MVGSKTSTYVLAGAATAILILLLVLSGTIYNVPPSINQFSSPSSINTTSASHDVVVKPVETLYQVRTLGDINDTIHLYIFRSIANEIINKYGKGLINGSFYPRYYVVLYNSYKDYRAIMCQHNDLESISNLLNKISCRILSERMYVVIQHNSKAKINITLVFEKGIAVCGEKYKPLPRIDSSWIIKDGFHIAVFNYLNITRTVHVNMQTGSVVDSHGRFIGEWIFHLTNRSMYSNETLILYNVLPKIIMKIDNKTYSLANLIYVEKCGDEYIAKPIMILRNGTIVHRGGLILIEKIISPYQNIGSCPICGENIRIMNLPPFLTYRKIVPENKTLIMYDVKTNMFSRANHHKELMTIVIVGKHEHIYKTINGEIIVKHIIYGVKIRDNCYVIGINLGLINLTYSNDGSLLELEMSVTTGLLYNALPMIVDKVFCIGYNSLVDASAIEISMISR